MCVCGGERRHRGGGGDASQEEVEAGEGLISWPPQATVMDSHAWWAGRPPLHPGVLSGRWVWLW